ncbi:MAG: isopentenyl phosphate kinase [Methanocellales archaeon]|nr:isopentenyl phosphate kinase [Methanocellales archaeon]MDD3291169.1 isopentenyl phosphate kinase [Methanocellales archaeon]MDD5235269.1 isopentenyl phosphate kinase [Methanocellales archaeon]MDD5484575.1 isopentenyl phosphate kinase [Methanocellales archaeon]
MSEVTILKIGGSVLTDRSKERTLKLGEINRIAKEIASADVRDLIIVHGAGSFGHPQAKRFDLDVPGKCGYETILIHNIVKELNRVFIEKLAENGMLVVPVHPLNCTISREGRLENMMTDQIRLMLKNDLVPVFHGDVVMDRIWGRAILSGDQIVAHVAKCLNAERVGIGTNVDGIMEGTKVMDVITPEEFCGVKKLLKGSKDVDVTGGMASKANELFKLAEEGVSSHVFNASKKGLVMNFLSGERNFGTIIRGD